MPRASPTVAHFEFAARVRGRREELNLAATAVSSHLGFSRNFYSAIENSRSLLAVSKLMLLLEVLQFNEVESAELSELLEVARTPGWWQPYAPLVSESVAQFFGLEVAASTIRSHESLVFHGLLQSPDYARNVMSAAPDVSVLDVSRSLDLRLRRQEEVLRSHPLPEMTFLFGEAVLMQRFGGREVLRGQLIHLLDLADEVGPRLQLRVQSFNETPKGLVSASTLVLLEFDSPHLGMVAYGEAGVPQVVTDDAEVEVFSIEYEQALTSSLDSDQTRALISKRIRDLE